MPGPLVCVFAITTILPSNPTDRRLGLIALIMFFAGIALACSEVVRWWKARMDRYERPPLSKVISYEVHSDRRWYATRVLWFRLPKKPRNAASNDVPARIPLALPTASSCEPDSDHGTALSTTPQIHPSRQSILECH